MFDWAAASVRHRWNSTAGRNLRSCTLHQGLLFPPLSPLSLSLSLSLLWSLLSVISWLLIILLPPFMAVMCTSFIAHHVKSDCIIPSEPAPISLRLQSQCLSVCLLHNGDSCQQAIKSKTPQADFWLFCFGWAFFFFLVLPVRNYQDT